ncbi:MAG: ATP-binding cassette domain-containing protein [Sedimentisphaerales bacterium]|nr:ATP-binding cassette domain-containing protein [Sedimentisphaerales bacterium]
MIQSNESQSNTPTKPLLRVKGLKKYFTVSVPSKGFLTRRTNAVKAVDDVSFDIMPGDILGVVGESGCGKTTMARTILRAIDPTSGTVELTLGDHTVDIATLKASKLKPLRQKMQMIFQDPFSSLNPRMTVGDIIGEPLVIHKLARGSELKDRVVEILKKVGLAPEHAVRYPHAFSGGQRQRIGIARALIMNPALVVADEAVSALDVSVQAQVINLLQDLQEEFKLTYIFVAHDLSVVKHICDRVAVMYAGKIVEMAPTDEIFDDPLHPYTRALLSAIPLPDPDVPMRFALGGEVADPGALPGGCSFHPRCDKCEDECKEKIPSLREYRPGHLVACHRAGNTPL